ncbi:MAG: tetratricopeptide repeat protein [Candidatus Lokiarchaeota archaeon]|nr:tetratricopeptide repeat protein [Candidatus Lokiarchaeota archaeon]
MNKCPFCKSPIEISWSYCRNCNKPLITDINNLYNNRIRPIPDGTSIYANESEEEEEFFDVNIVDDEAIEYELSQLENQLTDSERKGKNMGDLLLKKASLFYKKRDYSNALKYLELALENFKEEENVMNLIITHNEIGLLHEETGFFDQAIYHFDRALSFIEEIDDLKKQIQVLNNLGNVYHLINDLESSNKYYQKALTLADGENLELEAIKTASNLVEILLSLEDYDRVKRILKRNLNYFIKSDDIYGVIQTRTKYGKMYYHLGEDYYDQSFKCLIGALELIDGIKDHISIFIRKKLEWECYLYIGHLHTLWDNDLEAEDYLLKSLEAVRTFEIQENIKEGIVLEAIAKFYSLKGEDSKAIDYFSYSKDIYQKFGDKLKIAEMKYHVAKIFQEYIQNNQKAIQYYEEALEIFESLNKFKIAADIHNILGDINISNQSYELALRNFESARKLYAELEDDDNKAIIDGKINSLKDTENHNATF